MSVKNVQIYLKEFLNTFFHKMVGKDNLARQLDKGPKGINVLRSNYLFLFKMYIYRLSFSVIKSNILNINVKKSENVGALRWSRKNGHNWVVYVFKLKKCIYHEPDNECRKKACWPHEYQLTSDHRLSANFDKEVLLNCDVFFILKKGLNWNNKNI